MADDQLQKYDPVAHKALLNKTAIDYMKIIEEKNRIRVLKLRKTRTRNLISGLCLGTFALCVYGYTLYSVKQETFLDDFNPPVLIPSTESKNSN